MSQTLEEFIEEQTIALQKFKQYWEEQNKLNSEQFPNELPSGQEGLWVEMFTIFQNDVNGH